MRETRIDESGHITVRNICYDLIGFIPLSELMTQEMA